MDATIKLVLAHGGGLRPLARKLGISHTAPLSWARVPLRHIFEIEKITGLRREVLRPDVFGVPRPRRRRGI